jgi:hypothetical protein
MRVASIMAAVVASPVFSQATAQTNGPSAPVHLDSESPQPSVSIVLSGRVTLEAVSQGAESCACDFRA